MKGFTYASVDMIFANGAPCISLSEDLQTISIGNTWTTSFNACDEDLGGSIITGGVTNEIALHTTSGKTYPVVVLIP